MIENIGEQLDSENVNLKAGTLDEKLEKNETNKYN